MTQPFLDQGLAPPPGAVLLGNVNFIPPGLEGYYKDPFVYSVVFSNIGAGVTQTQFTQIQNDSYFVVVAQQADIWDAATGNTTNLNPAVAPMTVRISDSSSGKFQMDQPVAIGSIFGIGTQPHVMLYRARLFLPGGQISVELSNRSGAAQTVRLAFEGFKCYKVPDELPTM
jgi:hypothetical protein